jgi:hypothetical protein
MNPKPILKWLLSLSKTFVDSRVETAREIDVLRRIVQLQGSALAELLDLCADRFTGDHAALHNIRQNLAAQADWSTDFKRALQRGQHDIEQVEAIMAVMGPLISDMPDA